MKYLPYLLYMALGVVPTIVSGQPYFASGPAGITVTDKDRNILIGANITLVSGADTLRGTTVKRVFGSWVDAYYECDRVFRDSVDVRISYVGYKPFTRRYSPVAFNQGFTVSMEDDEQAIGQIVVIGRDVAVVVKGDTTVYNASAFKTMEGDRLSELLSQLPDVEVKDHKIYAGGEEIKRVYVDGLNLFGSNTDFALTDLKTSDVKNVKVYEEENALAKRVGDKNVPKEKVMDVVTHSKRRVIQGGSVTLLGGASFEEDYSGKHEIRHSETASFYRNTQKGSLHADLTNSKDGGGSDPVASGTKTTPRKEFDADLSHEYRRGDSTSVFTTVRFSRDRTRTSSSDDIDYFPTSEFSSRVSDSRSENDQKSYRLSVGNQTLLRRNSHSFYSNFNFNFSDRDGRDDNLKNQTIDDESTHTDTRSSTRDKEYTLNAVVRYNRYFSAKTVMVASASVNVMNSTGDGRNIDTLASDPGLRVRLHNDTRGRTSGFNAGLQLRRQVGESSNLSAEYTIRYNSQDSKQLSVDYLLLPQGKPDSVNSYDYTVNSLWNTLTGKWSYHRNNLFINASVSGSVYQVDRHDRLPDEVYTPHRFMLFNPSFTLTSGKLQRRFMVSLDLRTDGFSVDMLRNSLNAVNPQFLQAGNPDLRPPHTASANLRYTFLNSKKARSLSFGLSAGYTYNYITTRQRLFKEDTYLPEYDYTARQWSQLTTYTNIDGNYNLAAYADFSKRLSALKSTIRAGLRYSFQNSPYFLAETPYESQKHDMSLTASFSSGFSSKIKLEINSFTLLSNYKTQDDKTLYLRELLRGDLKTIIARKFFTTVSCIYELSRDNRKSSRPYDNVSTNFEAGRKFGKQNRFSVSLGVVNLFNQTDNQWTAFNADYISTTRVSYLGRYGYLKAYFEF